MPECFQSTECRNDLTGIELDPRHIYAPARGKRRGSIGGRALTVRLDARWCRLAQIRSLCFSELYPLVCTFRRALDETARRLGRRSFPSPRGQSRRSTIALPCPAHLPQWACGRASERLQHAEWQASGWDQRELRFGFSRASISAQIRSVFMRPFCAGVGVCCANILSTSIAEYPVLQ
jgi:hypothetical protein